MNLRRLGLWGWGIAFTLMGTEISSASDYGYRNPMGREWPKDRLTVAILKRWIAEDKIQSLDELLQKIKTSQHSQIFAEPVLMHSSRSLHRADVSPDFPRLLFARDGLVLAMAGNPDGDHYENMEAIEYDGTSGKFSFHAFQFAGRDSGSQTVVTDNPKKCQSCHGSDPRPIWGGYPVWPGAYGSHAGNLTKKEKEDLATFSAGLSEESHARYRIIAMTPAVYTEKANIHFGFELNAMNFKRVFAQIESSEAWKRFAPTFGALLANCDQPMGGMAETDLKSIRERVGVSFDEFLEKHHQSLESEANRRAQGHNRLQGQSEDQVTADTAGYFDFSREQQVVGMRWLLEGTGFDPDRIKAWSMSRAPAGWSYSFSNGHYGIEDFLETHIKPSLAQYHPTSAVSQDRCTAYREAQKKLAP